ncbi:MAG: hypothetical protein HKO67_06830 [Flavobacteriaceae bacterium]|nr:hypothetical protein [Flavobacteriaceae bacterium]
MDLSNEKLIDIAQFTISRLDGAWFMAIAKEMGIDKAWEMEVAAWKQFSYVFGKRLKNDLFPDPVWPQSFIEAIDVLSKVLKIEEREVKVGEGTITVRAKDCEIQKAIAKAGIADCGIVTKQTYQGIAAGLFGKEFIVSVEHTKNLNHGDECCEVVISRPGSH